MSRREESSSSKVNRVFVGNLPPDIRTKDVEDLFYKFGDISFVDLKTRRGPPFAFVEFYDARDAKEAVYSRDGYDYDGYKLRVEFPKGRERVGGGGGGGGRRKSRDRESRRGPPTRRTNHRIKVTGLPATGSWQDLKDHMREAGEVCYADVFKDGTGVVEFMRYDDMKYALKKLDDSRFRSHEGETSYVRVMEDTGRSSGGSRSRSRSRSHSPVTKKSRASPTYSPARDSRSRSRSRSIKSSPGSSRSRSPVNDSHDRSRSRSNHKSRSASRSPAHSDDSRRSRSDSHSSHSRSRSR